MTVSSSTNELAIVAMIARLYSPTPSRFLIKAI